jgi:hypothetical protein
MDAAKNSSVAQKFDANQGLQRRPAQNGHRMNNN